MIKIAQNVPIEVGDPSSWGIPSPTAAISDIPSALTHTMNWFLGIAGFLAVIAVIYAGFMYITSAGDTAQAESAKKNLTFAIIGIVLIALSAVIVNTVQDVLSRTASGTATVATTSKTVAGAATTNLEKAAQVLKTKTDPASVTAATKIQDILTKLKNGTISEKDAATQVQAISATLKKAGLPDIQTIAQSVGQTGQVLGANVFLEQLEKVTDLAEAKKIGGQIYQYGIEIGAITNSDLAKQLQKIGLQVQAGADLVKMISQLKQVLTTTNDQSSTSNATYTGDYTQPNFQEPTPTATSDVNQDYTKPNFQGPTPTPENIYHIQ